MPSPSAKLWIVGTPLGNLTDCSPRAKEILSSVNTVLAEDTRKAGLLFAHLNIRAQRFVSFHEHNENERLAQVLDFLKSGQSFALISDAGMPLMADPGFRLVQACRKEGIAVGVIPGPNAAITALVGSGIAPQPFSFLGFLPRKKGDIQTLFSKFEALNHTLIFYESKNRIEQSLHTAFAVLGERHCCIARELTKIHEEFIFFSLAEIPNLSTLLGEITIVIAPAEKEQFKENNELTDAVIAQAKVNNPHCKSKELAQKLATKFPQHSGKEIYALLQQKK